MVELYHAYYRDNVQWNMDRYHFHTQYEILLTVAGHAKIFITDRCYQLEKGRLLLIHPSVIHRSFCQTAGNYQRYIVHIPESTLLALSTDQSNLLSIFSLTEQLYTLSEKQLQQIIPFKPAWKSRWVLVLIFGSQCHLPRFCCRSLLWRIQEVYCQ